MLTQDQVKANIDAFLQQGAPHEVIQNYLDSLKGQQTTPIVPTEQKSFLGKATDFVGDVTGFGGLINAATGKSAPIFKPGGLISPEGRFQQPFNPEGVKQAVGAGVKLGLTAGTLGTGGIARTLSGRAIESGLTGGAYQVANNLEKNKPVGENVGLTTGLSAAIPYAGKFITDIAGPLVSKLGGQIQRTVLKPNASDLADGFKVENINKYGLGGGPQSTLKKAQTKVGELVSQLNEKIGAGAPLDLGQVFKQTETELTKGSKFKNFGNIRPIGRVLQNLQSEIESVSPSGVVNLPDAQDIKQAAGLKGAWVYGSADPDATAVEKVYTTFYRNLKTFIEKHAPEGVHEINQQISDIVPIIHAAMRRIPIAERNELVGLKDIGNLGLTFLNPGVGLGLEAANIISKSGTAGSAISRFGNYLQQPGTNNITQRIFGR